MTYLSPFDIAHAWTVSPEMPDPLRVHVFQRFRTRCRPARLGAEDKRVERKPVPLWEWLVVLVGIPRVEQHDLAGLERTVLSLPILHHLGCDDRALSVWSVVKDAADVDDRRRAHPLRWRDLVAGHLAHRACKRHPAALGRYEVRGTIGLRARVLVNHVTLAVVGERALREIVTVGTGDRLEPVEGPPLERGMGRPVGRQLLGYEHSEVYDLGIAHRIGDLVADRFR